MNKFIEKNMRSLFVLTIFTMPAFAADRSLLYGKWGTEAQCNGALITPQGTKRAAPFDIRPDWLKHGDVWCYLNWGTVAPTSGGGIFTVAQAQCGEDAVRGYNIKFRLDESELTLVWNLWIKNGPLMRCTER